MDLPCESRHDKGHFILLATQWLINSRRKQPFLGKSPGKLYTDFAHLNLFLRIATMKLKSELASQPEASKESGPFAKSDNIYSVDPTV